MHPGALTSCSSVQQHLHVYVPNESGGSLGPWAMSLALCHITVWVADSVSSRQHCLGRPWLVIPRWEVRIRSWMLDPPLDARPKPRQFICLAAAVQLCRLQTAGGTVDRLWWCVRWEEAIELGKEKKREWAGAALHCSSCSSSSAVQSAHRPVHTMHHAVPSVLMFSSPLPPSSVGRASEAWLSPEGWDSAGQGPPSREGREGFTLD